MQLSEHADHSVHALHNPSTAGPEQLMFDLHGRWSNEYPAQ